jgi:leader peptidase (prepilin peptidase)/N-methyltransferase
MIPFVFSLYGLCIGSFLNVVIYRVPRELSVAKGRSRCPACGHTLHAADLVPLFSFLFLGGKCRYCKAPISMRYPLVEAMTGALFALCALQWGFSWYAGILCLYGSVLIAAALIDREHGIIPDRLHVVILLLAAASFLTGPAVSLPDRLIGALGLGGAMLLVSLVTGGGIGGGDIKLLAASGLLLGWKLTVPAFFLAYVLAAIRYLGPLLKKKLGRNYEAPMGPWFSLALVIAALWGRQLLALWLHVAV